MISPINDRLKRLTFEQGLVFCLFLVERMIYNFEKFTSETGMGGSCTLRKYTCSLWEHVESGFVSNITHLDSTKCFEAAPESEDFASMYTSPAIDAANATALCVNLAILKDKGLFIEISQLAIETVDLFIVGITTAPYEFVEEDKISFHELMVAEEGYQLSLLDFCEMMPEGKFLLAYVFNKLVNDRKNGLFNRMLP